MNAVVSALFTLAAVVGAWSAVSVLSLPLLVLCVRTQERANARLTRRMRREDWLAASRGW